MISTDKLFLKVIAIAVLAIAVFSVITSKGTVFDLMMPEKFRVSEARELPPLRFQNEAGESLGLEKFRGRLVLLNLWATWCAPCAKEKPTLQAANLRWGTQGLFVLSVAEGDSVEKVKTFFREHHIEFLQPFFDPDSSILQAVKARGLPTTIIVNREGKEIYRHSGPADWDDAGMQELLEKVLKAK